MVEETENGKSASEGAAGKKKSGPRVSSRVPETIEGRAVDVSRDTEAAPNPPPESQVSADAPETSLEAADAPLKDEIAHPASPEGPATDAPMPGETRAAEAPFDEPAPRRRSTAPLAATGLVVALAAGGLAWYFVGGGDELLNGTTSPKTPPPVRTASPQPASPTSASPAAPKPATPPPAYAQSTPPAAPQPAAPRPPAASAPPSGSMTRIDTAPPAPPKAAPVAPPAPTPSPPPASPLAESRKPEPPPAAPPSEPRKADVPPAPAASTPLTTPGTDAKVADLDRRVTDIDTRLAALASAPAKPAAETTSALNAQTARLGRIEETLAALDRRLGGLEQKLSEPKADTRAPEAPDIAATKSVSDAAARTVVAQGLLAAVQNGEPFATQVAALRSLGADEKSVARLATLATSGVPTLAQLRARFSELRPKLHPQVKIDPGATWSDKMLTRLTSLVSIRPAGERAGASPEAVASRADAALARGDVATALTEMRTLAPPDNAVAKDWIDAAARRVDAEADARALVASSLATLAKPKS